MSRRRFSMSPLGVAAVGVGGCLLGIVAATLATMSPQQAAATRAAPLLPLPTTQVVAQTLRDAAEVPCSYQGEQVETAAPASAGKLRARVVTSIDAKPGKKLTSGTRVLSVSGRPVIAFASAMPFFRNLGPGDTGVDVRELEKGLVAAGKLAKADSVFGEDTARALSAINKAAGLGAKGRFLADAAWAVPAGSRVSEIPVQVGDVVDKKTTVATANTQAGLWVCELPSGVAVAVGDKLAVAGQDGTVTVKKVTAVEESDQAASATMTVDAPGVKAEGDLTVRVVSSATEGDVLTVPVGALFPEPAGGSQLRPAVGDPIAVTVGVVSGGWAEVRADGLKAGDSVQLGGTG